MFVIFCFERCLGYGWLRFCCVLVTFGCGWLRFCYRLVTFWFRFGYVLVTFWLRFGCVRLNSWLRFGYIWVTFGYVWVTFWLRFGYARLWLVTFWLQFGYVLATFWLHSGYVLVRFWLRSVLMHALLAQLCLLIFHLKPEKFFLPDDYKIFLLQSASLASCGCPSRTFSFWAIIASNLLRARGVELQHSTQGFHHAPICNLHGETG